MIDSLILRRFDKSASVVAPKDISPASAVEVVNDDELKPLLWNMLQLACLGMSMEAIQENPILVRYVENMFDEDGSHHRFTRLGVIADVRTKKKTTSSSKDDENTCIIRGIGAAWIQCWNPDNEHKGYGTVRDDIPELTIAVLPDYHGQGIGHCLLQYLIQYAQEQNHPEQHHDSAISVKIIPAISLSVQADNDRAVRLYQSLNFTKVEGSDYTNEEGTTWYGMVRQLS